MPQVYRPSRVQAYTFREQICLLSTQCRKPLGAKMLRSETLLLEPFASVENLFTDCNRFGREEMLKLSKRPRAPCLPRALQAGDRTASIPVRRRDDQVLASNGFHVLTRHIIHEEDRQCPAHSHRLRLSRILSGRRSIQLLIGSALNPGQTTTGSPDLFAVGLVPPLLLAIDSDCLGMRLFPLVRQQALIIGRTGKQLIEHILDVKLHVQIMPLGAADQTHHFCTSLSRLHIANEKPSLSSKSYLLHQLLNQIVVNRDATIKHVCVSQIAVMPCAVMTCPPPRNRRNNPIEKLEMVVSGI